MRRVAALRRNTRFDRPAQDAEEREAGVEGRRMLLERYALHGVTAEFVCVLSHFITVAGLPDFADLAMRPDQGSSGNYQQHLDLVLNLDTGNHYMLDCPLQGKFDRHRILQPVPVALPHEEMWKEEQELSVAFFLDGFLIFRERSMAHMRISGEKQCFF